MIRVAGLDVGLSLERKTSGLAIIVGPNISLDRRVGGANAYQPILAAGSFQVIAIDGPIVPDKGEALSKRAVERLFASGRFQRRCKPGFSHVKGTGLELRRAAGSAADCLAAATSASPPFLGVQSSSIVEAFPNAFLGVCLDDRCYEAMPALKRGQKFDWLYDQWVQQKLVARLPLPSDAKHLPMWFARTSDHEERAALVCALTALLVAHGTFTAIGDESGGWFFLPPWNNWQCWARTAVENGSTRLNEHGAKLRIKMAPVRS